MSSHGNFTSLDLYRELKRFGRHNIVVKTDFPGQVEQIDNLLANDTTGLVSTMVDFMVHSATVSMKIETQNEPLNKLLKKWQTDILNRNVNIDIPGGLRALSTQNYKERWRSSLLALKVIWGTVKFENQGTFIVPKKMWFLDGASIITKSSGALNTRSFSVKVKGKTVNLKNGLKDSIFIRKPYTAWHDDKVVPYLTQRGTVFNALIKEAIVQKQSDVIESIIPILLQLKAGSDELALQGLNVSEEAFKKLKQGLIDAKDKFDQNHNFGDLIASLRHDVNLEYLIPDLVKVFDPIILKSTDRNLLSSLGLIELQGFSSTREEAILNPKVLVEEVTDGVLDWSNLLQDVMVEMMIRNKEKHPNLANNEIQVIPGTIKAFITDEMRVMFRSMYDRGVISKQNFVEDITNLNFEVQVNRRTNEDTDNLQKIMKPPVIQNIEKDIDPLIDDQNLEDQNKKTDTPETDTFNSDILRSYFAREHLRRRRKKKKKCPDKDNPDCPSTTTYSKDVIMTPDDLPEEIKKLSFPAQLTYFMTYNTAVDIDDKSPEEAHKLAMDSIQIFITFDKKKTVGKEKIIGDKSEEKEIISIFKNIDELPDNVKNVLPIPAQMIWMKVFNSIFEETSDEVRAIRGAWSEVGKQYEKDPDKKKWVKKASLEDYKSEMSPYAYKLFTEMYDVALEHSNSHSNAITTALIVVDKICIKNKDGILVKDKTINKTTLEKIDRPDFVSKILDLEIKEKQIKLMNKLLEEDK